MLKIACLKKYRKVRAGDAGAAPKILPGVRATSK
jgi:hypothetical protein